MQHRFSPTFVPLSLILIVSLLAACNTRKPPKDSFDAYATPPPPDYSQLDDWAAHPAKKDQADTVPSAQFKDRQSDAAADVFYIHPTTTFDTKAWNGDLRDQKLNKRTENLAIKHQASIFNAAGRVFAPRYRQMVYGGFWEKEDLRSVQRASQLAYQDVQNAFQYYLDHENQGRPFIIATHSQGTAHAIRLIREKIEQTPLLDHLIAAYLVGWPVPIDTFSVLKPCENPDETGCFVSWCTFESGHAPEALKWYRKSVSVNPITWRRDTLPSKMEDHQPLVMPKYRKIYPGVISAKVEKGWLWVNRPDIPGTWVLRSHNLHIADYNLFWGNVRSNAAHRVQRFLNK